MSVITKSQINRSLQLMSAQEHHIDGRRMVGGAVIVAKAQVSKIPS